MQHPPHFTGIGSLNVNASNQREAWDFCSLMDGEKSYLLFVWLSLSFCLFASVSSNLVPFDLFFFFFCLSVAEELGVDRF
jgi:hypothetical protein